MPLVARVVVENAAQSFDKIYSYRVPEGMPVRPGCRVTAPFGAGNRRTEGIVLACEDGRPPDPKRKTILTLLDEEPVLDAEALQLALWMRERWFCTVYDAARAMLPAGLYFSLQDRYAVAPGIDRETAYASAGKSEHARRILELVFASGGSAEQRQIREAFGTKDPNPALRQLTFCSWRPAPSGAWGTRRNRWPCWPSRRRRPWPK